MSHENIRFNARAYSVIMNVGGRLVLHIVDQAILFSLAHFLIKVSTDSVRKSIILSWSSIYTELLQTIMIDEGAKFRKIFAELARLHDITIEKSGVQSHNSLGIGEIYRKPLRDTNRKLKLYHPTMQRQLLLALSVKAMNDTLGAEGIIPSALVFGEFTSLRTCEGYVIPQPSLTERAEAALNGRRYMAQHLAQTRIQRPLRHNPPSATDRDHRPGENELV